MLYLFLCLLVQTKTDSIFADYDKPLYQSCRLAERIQGSIILSLPRNASNHRNGVISLNRVKEPYTPLRLKSYQEYNEILWIISVLKGIGVVVSLTTQAAALITFGKWGLRKYHASQGAASKTRKTDALIAAQSDLSWPIFCQSQRPFLHV